MFYLTISVGDLTEEAVGSPEEVMELLEAGLNGRHVAATKMNNTSSRSHTVFRLTIESRYAPVAGNSEDDGKLPITSALTSSLAYLQSFIIYIYIIT